MSVFSPDSLPENPEAAELRRDARATIAAYRAFLSNPAFVHNVDLAVLAKVAADEDVAPRERRRAAEMLARYRLMAMEALASLTGAKEQSLDKLGLQPTQRALALTQVNTKIEIVRADDWRQAALSEPTVEVLPADADKPGHDAAPPAPNAPDESDG